MTERVLIKRKYVLTKVAAGDYLLPSNDQRTIWRIHRYTEGPSSGLDWPRDREVWGIWAWDASDAPYVDTKDWSRWTHWAGLYETRNSAIKAALSD